MKLASWLKLIGAIILFWAAGYGIFSLIPKSHPPNIAETMGIGFLCGILVFLVLLWFLEAIIIIFRRC